MLWEFQKNYAIALSSYIKQILRKLAESLDKIYKNFQNI